MKFIFWCSTFLSLQLYSVQCETEVLLAKLKQFRAENGIAHDYLEFDNSQYDESRKATEFQPFKVSDIFEDSDWPSNVIWCLVKGYGMVRGNTGMKMQKGNKVHEYKFYSEFNLEMIEERFREMLYDIRNVKVGIKFYYEEGQNTRFLITFRVLSNEDFVVFHLRYLRARAKLMDDKVIDSLASIPFRNLNEFAKWTIKGRNIGDEYDKKMEAVTISPDLFVINVEIHKHKDCPIPLRIMKTLDSLVHQRGPYKHKLLSPTAHSMGVYVVDDESPKLVIVIECMDIKLLRNKLWRDFMKKRTDNITYVTAGRGKDLLEDKPTDKKLNEIAMGVVTSTEYGFNYVERDDNVLLPACGCDGKLIHGIFRQRAFEAKSYEKEDFQYTMLRNILLEDMYTTSLINEIFNRKYIGAGFAFNVVIDKYEFHFWRLCVVFKSPKTFEG